VRLYFTSPSFKEASVDDVQKFNHGTKDTLNPQYFFKAISLFRVFSRYLLLHHLQESPITKTQWVLYTHAK